MAQPLLNDKIKKIVLSYSGDQEKFLALRLRLQFDRLQNKVHKRIHLPPIYELRHVKRVRGI